MKKEIRMNTILFLVVGVLTAGCGFGTAGQQDLADANSTRENGRAMENTGEPGAREALQQSDDRVAVQGYEVTRGSLSEALPVSGTVTGHREATVVSETQGVIQEVLFELGDSVAAGDPLVRFDSRAEAAALRQAEEQFAAAQLDLESAQRRFERGSASQTELTQVRAATAGAESALQQARRIYENRTVRAPFAGHIADSGSEIQVGNLVNIGSQIARLVDTSRLRMRVGVGERTISRVTTGSPAEVSIPSIRSDSFTARVIGVGAGADPLSGSFPVLLEWDNPPEHRGRSGVTGTAHIYAEDVESLIIIPAAAVTSRGGRTVVFVAKDGEAREREVRLAGRRGPRAAVEDGLSTGEVVINSGVSSLEDGTTIEVTLIGSSSDIR